MEDAAPYIDPAVDDPARPVCGICPSKRLPRDRFVVYDRPNRAAPFNPDDGLRYTLDGAPACVHPHKIGLEPDLIAPESTPEPSTEETASGPSRRRWRWSFLGR